MAPRQINILYVDVAGGSHCKKSTSKLNIKIKIHLSQGERAHHESDIYSYCVQISTFFAAAAVVVVYCWFGPFFFLDKMKPMRQ